MIASGNIQTWLSEYGMMLWTSVISIAAVAGYVYMVYVGLANVNEDKQKEIDEHIKEDIAASKQDRSKVPKRSKHSGPSTTPPPSRSWSLRMG